LASVQEDTSRFTSGLTTTMAPFIEQAQQNGELYIEQPYDLYSQENDDAWRQLFARMRGRWEQYANDHFMRGIRSLCLDPDHVPRLCVTGARNVQVETEVMPAPARVKGSAQSRE